MKKYCLALDLKNDPVLIEAYEEYHQNVWPEVLASIKDSGIKEMTIYRLENHLYMFLETTDEFSFEKKSTADSANPKVQEWEALMWKYQQAMPGAKGGEKWMQAKKIFEL